MNHEQQIHKQLGNLPIHSLNSEQKQRILLKLKEEQATATRKTFLQPLVAIIFSVVLFSFLVYHEFNQNNIGTANQPEPTSIELTSPAGELFTFSETSQEVIGVQGEVALLNTFGHFVAKDKRRGAKMMIFYWGNTAELVGKNFTVKAMNSYGDTLILSEGILYHPLNNEDAHTLTSFPPFPTDGKWQLSFYVEDEIHGEFTLEVLPPFPKTEHYTLVDSPMEIPVGKKTQLSIESNWEDKDEIEVSLLNKDGVVISKDKFVKDAEYIDSFTNKPLYYYIGQITLPEQGNWTLIIDGEKTEPFEN